MSTHLYRTVLASLALPLAVAGVCLAQAPQSPDPAIQRDGANRMKQEAKQEANVPVRASKLIGMEVYNHQDKHLGTIKDIVLAQDGQSVGYAVVSSGGALGVGDRLFAIPYRSLEYSSVKDSRIYLGIDEQAMKNAPGFNPDHWPDKAESVAYFKEIDKYYDKNAAAQPAAGRMEGTTVLGTPAPVSDGLVWSRRLSSLVGTNVQSPTGERLGEIRDVIIDWKTGKVQYDVLSFGGVLRIGDKLFAVPPSALKSKTDAKELVLAIDQQRLKTAPGFDKDNWPNFTDEAWQKNNDAFYAPQPTMTAP